MANIGTLAQWDDLGSILEQNRVINGFKNSMEKWDQVYYYDYQSDGKMVKQKLVNVYETNVTNANVLIYPRKDSTNIAGTSSLESVIYVDSSNLIHVH